ncbi:2,3-bisphosphoglycerate-dependent phosphoglycerate mutase [Planomicrobium soli]|uniref:2,3-bisphosphoglycerate-dependent phosphoglycerate mutase n=1 Tax=Planomicrobium soli TaxID=1176648 RepID=A0A2P8H219_9BACL|nr:histidine phosphatase family protein [Planomicrobium soli]PSL40253.1 2,3-bisphosphoglycerate-dependent phosphoglycerate mutase [Planomicrobium soli]
MTTNLYFVRHAHSVYTPDELARPLSEKGLQDACTVAELLKKESIDLVVSSPYKRAIQTVKGISENGIELAADFRERTLSERPVPDFASAVEKVWQDERFAWAGGESNIDARARGVKKTMELLHTHAGKNIVIGTHGNIMVLIMNHFNAVYDFQFWQSLTMPDIYKLTFTGTELIEVERIGRFT